MGCARGDSSAQNPLANVSRKRSLLGCDITDVRQRFHPWRKPVVQRTVATLRLAIAIANTLARATQSEKKLQATRLPLEDGTRLC
jgi:hypothetical protein